MFEIDDWTRRMCAAVRGNFETLDLNWSMPPGLKTAVICMTPRSGSSYLGSLFRANGWGDAQEHFRLSGNQLADFVAETGVKSYGGYIGALVERYASDSHYAVKADWTQFRPVYHFGAYARYFKQARYIYLTRSDILAQAVSRYIMEATGYGDTTQTLAPGKLESVDFNYDKICDQIRHLQAVATAWETFFAVERIEPLRITYEALVADPEATLQRIAAHIDADLPDPLVTETEYRRVTTPLNQALCDTFREHMRWDQAALLEALAPPPPGKREAAP